MTTIAIAGRLIGDGHPAYVIAEMSGNHNQSFDHATAIVRAASDAGADAVKLQTYTADTLTIDSRDEPFRVGKGTAWEGKTLYELYGEAFTPWEWQPKLKAIANDLGLACFSSPFDATAVDFLEAMDVPAYKIASFELVDLRLIDRVARTGKPLVISTGLGSLQDIEDAVATARATGLDEIALLKCSSAYPAPAAEINLNTIPDLARRFGVPVGLSDHTLGTAVPIAAVSVGATIIEKHLTLSRSDPGPDNAFSLEPNEFKEMVKGIRLAEQALGRVSYGATPSEEPSKVFRRSLFVVADIAAGEVLTEANIRSIRPGAGLLPKELPKVLGRRAAVSVRRGTPLSWDLLEPDTRL